jgi:pimeloyl-ACP methyl ester carboxylesterase
VRMKPQRAGYVPINGLNLYYKVHGDLGTAKLPLLLIPGPLMATDSMTLWTEAFARERAVIVFDQQGHGRTSRRERRRARPAHQRAPRATDIFQRGRVASKTTSPPR